MRRQARLMTSAKQRAANRANAIKSTGPQSGDGKRRSSLNAAKHRLSLPVDENLFNKEITEISLLVRADCSNDAQAFELARRIIQFERNQAFLMSQTEDQVQGEIAAWGLSPQRLEMAALIQDHKNKKTVLVTFTTSNKRPKGKERTEEIKFIEDFIKLQDRVHLYKYRTAQKGKLLALRYQKRATNQLIKGVRAVAKDNDF